MRKICILVLCLSGIVHAQPKTITDHPRLAQGTDDILLIVDTDPNSLPQSTLSIGLEELMGQWLSSGVFLHEAGGLEADVSAYDGFVYITGGVTSAKTQNAGTDVTADLEEETHASEHAVSAADTVFPADPDADRVLLWDDDPGALVWYDISGAGFGDMLKATYDVSGDGFVDGNDVVYGAAWNGDVNAPSMNAVYDKIEILAAAAGDMLKSTYDVSADGFVDGNDVAYGAAWDNDVNAPSMNAVYDEMETKGDITGQAWTGVHGFGGATSLELPNGTNPDVDTTGQVSIDTDGGNEPNSISLRTPDAGGDTQYVLAQTNKPIQFTITEPDQLEQADYLVVFTNNTGFTIHLTEIQAVTDTDDSTFTLVEIDADGANATTIEAVTISTDGTNIFYTTVAAADIDNAVIENGHRIIYDASASTPGYIHVALQSYRDGDVD